MENSKDLSDEKMLQMAKNLIEMHEDPEMFLTMSQIKIQLPNGELISPVVSGEMLDFMRAVVKDRDKTETDKQVTDESNP